MDLMNAVIHRPELFECFDLLKFMVVLIDRRGLIIYANGKASEVLGTKRSELIGTACLDRFAYAGGGAELRMRLDRFMSGPISVLQYEGPFRSAGGDERIISWDCHRLQDGVGNITGAICSGLDLTDMRRIECELQMSSDSYRMLFEASPMALIEEDYSRVHAWLDAKMSEGVSDFNAYFSSNPQEVVDLLKLVKTNFMNVAALKLLGVKDKDEFTKNYNAFFSEGSYARFREQLLWILEKRTVFEGDSINYTLDGRRIFTRLKWSIVPGHENSLSRVLISIVDLTDRKRLEDELKRYTEQLEVLVEERTKRLREAERLAAIGETATMVGHDLRNPLQSLVNTMYLMGDVVRAMVTSDERTFLEQSLVRMESNVDYMNKIVSDLQDLARPLKLERANVNLRRLIDETVQSLNIPEAVNLKGDIGEGISVYGDANMLKRAVANILTNAIQALPNGGSIKVVAAQECDLVTLTVADNGVGIAEEHIPKLFNPLFTTKSKGTGLGLAIVKRVIDAHGGRVRVESRVGAGTAFVMDLPATKMD